MSHLKILFVEDVINDMELAQWELKKAGIDFICERVENKQNFIDQIAVFKPDLIISDYFMPNFDGMSALKTVLEINYDIPVIIYTGSINEETAVECMKSGAFDYILKDNMLRLPFAVKEAYKKSLIVKKDQEAQRVLTASEKKYEDLYNSMAQGVVYVSREGLVTMLNPAAMQILEVEQALPAKIGSLFDSWEIRSEDGKPYNISDYVYSQAFITGKKINNLLLGAVHKKLKLEKWLSVNAIPQYKADEPIPYQAFITFEDVTLRKLAQLELARSESSYRFLFDSNPHPMWVYDAKSLIIRNVNQAAIHKYGYSRINFLEATISNLWLEPTNKQIEELLLSKDVIENSGPWAHKTSKGEILHVEIASHNIIFEGSHSRIIVAYDLSTRIKAEKALITSEKKYRNLFENSPIGIFTTTLDGEISFANDALAKLLQYDSTDELYKVPIATIYVDIARRELLIQLLKADGYIKNFEIANKTKTGEIRNLLLSALLDGNIITGMIMDITERKEFELELLASKQKAEESDKLKTAFLANLSHEVRTPMNAILGFSELLADLNKEDETMKMYVDTIHDNSFQLLNIITDIIEISKIETEKIVTYKSEFHLSDFKPMILELFNSKAIKKGLKLKVSGFDNSVVMSSDEQKLKKILVNLVDNAVKFTEKGEVTVACKLLPGRIEIHVTDTGVGIPESHDELIFESFRQSDMGYNRTHGGTGLGLSIAKAFVEILGGKIWFSRNINGGSTFTFTIPVNWKSLPIDNNKPISQTPDFSKYTFLIAEDDSINYIFINSLLGCTKAKILYAANGMEAIEQINANPNIDLVLMDIKMPIMNGYDATKKIRETFPDVPIIATTAYAMSGDKEKCIVAGCNSYISKPINRLELFRVIKQYLDIV